MWKRESLDKLLEINNKMELKMEVIHSAVNDERDGVVAGIFVNFSGLEEAVFKRYEKEAAQAEYDECNSLLERRFLAMLTKLESLIGRTT